ncbi:hypothetical protein ELP57_41710, partial [Klebsiella pneumoniae]|nr:hypothetical protein [Klebsiella pneumoniae]
TSRGLGDVYKRQIPGVATTASPSSEVGRFFETQSSKGGRYTVTLPDGTKVEELNKATAEMMVTVSYTHLKLPKKLEV